MSRNSILICSKLNYFLSSQALPIFFLIRVLSWVLPKSRVIHSFSLVNFISRVHLITTVVKGKTEDEVGNLQKPSKTDSNQAFKELNPEISVEKHALF